MTKGRPSWDASSASDPTPFQPSTRCQDCHDRVAEMVAYQLPNPGKLSSASLRRAAENDAGLDEIIQVCRLFQWLIPGLITNVAYFRHQLEAV